MKNIKNETAQEIGVSHSRVETMSDEITQNN